MTNEEKYKTPEGRAEEFRKFCNSNNCNECECAKDGKKLVALCEFRWLAIEAKEGKPLPCPFCGEDGRIVELKEGGFRAFCWKCLSASSAYSTKAEAIAAWNRRAK